MTKTNRTNRSTRTNRVLIGAAAGIGVLAGAAGIAAAATEGGSDPAPGLTRADAEAAAVEEVPGTVVEVETDDEGGRAVWSVEVAGADGAHHEVDVADDGSIVGRDTDDDGTDDDGTGEDATDDDGTGEDATDDGTDDAVDPALASVPRADAEATARAEAPGTVHQAQVEREDGRVVWDVEVDGRDGRRHDVQIDAETGEVVEHDIDD